MSSTETVAAAKKQPLFEYVDAAVGRVWTSDDALYVRSVLERIDELATELVRRAKGGR